MGRDSPGGRVPSAEGGGGGGVGRSARRTCILRHSGGGAIGSRSRAGQAGDGAGARFNEALRQHTLVPRPRENGVRGVRCARRRGDRGRVDDCAAHNGRRHCEVRCGLTTCQIALNVARIRCDESGEEERKRSLHVLVSQGLVAKNVLVFSFVLRVIFFTFFNSNGNEMTLPPYFSLRLTPSGSI